MRNRFIVALFFFSTVHLFAQQYVPFPTDSARWRVSYGMSIFGCTGYAGEAMFEITGDTILGTQTYHKIYEIGYSNGPGCYMAGYNGFVCGIREDSSKRIWRCYDGVQPEELLYDFNLNVGDSVNTMQNCGCDAMVDSIDSVLIGSAYRKRFIIQKNFFCGGGTVEVIEGIGSTNGLLECFGFLEATSSLNCYWESGFTLYPSSSANCVPLVEAIQETTSESHFTAYPNPAGNAVQISCANGFASAQLVTITDVDGRTMRSEMIVPHNGTLGIDRQNLSAGVYFVEVAGTACELVRVKVLFW